MKALVLYSSQTGRTKKFAEAIRSVLPKNTDFLPMEQAPRNTLTTTTSSLLASGFWIINWTAYPNPYYNG